MGGAKQLLLLMLLRRQYAAPITQEVQDIAKMSAITVDERASAC